MLNDTYITLFFAAMIVLALLLAIFWVEDKLQARHNEVLKRIDALGLGESEAAAIQRQFHDQCG